MRLWWIAFLSGAALAALHLGVSVILSQSYGDNALVWADLTGIFFISLSAGLVLGSPLARKFRAPNLLFTLCLISAVLVFVLSWAAPWLQKMLLARGLGPYSSSVIFSVILVLPASTLLASAAPAAWNIRQMQMSRALPRPCAPPEHGNSPSEAAWTAPREGVLRWFFFSLFLGGACGSFATLFLLPVVGHWGFLNALAVLLAVTAFLGLSMRLRLVTTCVAGLHFFFAGIVYQELVPIEAFVRAAEIAVREDEGDGRDGRAKRSFLTYAEVRKVFGEMRGKIVAAPDKSIGIKLVADALESLGNVMVSGSDFEKVYCETITDPNVLNQTIPFVKRIRLIESDGFGLIYFQIRRVQGSAQATLVIPQKEGYLTLLFKRHFTLHFTRKSPSHTRIAIGPHDEVSGGLFSSGPSHYTPVIAVDAVGPFDVTLVYIDIYNEQNHVSITVSGQGFIGGLKTKELAHLEK